MRVYISDVFGAVRASACVYVYWKFRLIIIPLNVYHF